MVFCLSGEFLGELLAWDADSKELRRPGTILLVGDLFGKSGLDFSEFVGNVDEVAEERFKDGTVTVGDSCEQSSKAVRRENGSKHHGEVLVMEEGDSTMGGRGTGVKEKRSKFRGGHGKRCV